MRMLPAACFGLLSLPLLLAPPVLGQETDGADDRGVKLDLEALEPPARESAPDERSEGTEDSSPSPSEDASADTLPKKTVVGFAAEAADLEETDQAQLKTLAELLKQSKARLTIVAYASVNDERSANAARRLALARAINLRHFLVAEGVDGTRINLQPQSESAGETHPENRAEIIIEGG